MRAGAGPIFIAVGAGVLAAFACGGGISDVHEESSTKSQPCITCPGAYNAASNPLHTNQMPDTCEDCHSTKAWSPVSLKDHRWYPLQNKHLEAKCVGCHTKGFRTGDTPKDCATCHKDAYDKAENPKHTGYPLECNTCHSDAGWRPSTYQHVWPLEGKHATASCTGCHTGEPTRFQGTPKTCLDCHQKDADAAKNPNHQGIPADCTGCHTPTGWRPSKYVHAWPLQGKHVLAPCNNCHLGAPPKYAGTTKDCSGCHQSAADASTYPNHKTFSKSCIDCHQLSGWKPAITGPHPEAKFPLTGGSKHADARIACQGCHVLAKGLSAGGQNTDCINCHLGSHVRPAIDNRHIQLNVPNYPTGSAATNFCLSCHPAGTK